MLAREAKAVVARVWRKPISDMNSWKFSDLHPLQGVQGTCKHCHVFPVRRGTSFGEIY